MGRCDERASGIKEKEKRVQVVGVNVNGTTVPPGVR